MTEKRQTSQGYIIRILQHFATKLRNITNFVMLFQAVKKFLNLWSIDKVLLNLFQAFSTPWFLFSGATNHHLVFFLLEIFNNIIQYQFDGKITTDLLFSHFIKLLLLQTIHVLEYVC